MDEFLSRFNAPVQFGNLSMPIIIIIGLIYLLQCFFGYKLQRIWIAAAGFIIGFSIAFLVFENSSSASFVIPVIAGIALGIIGGIIGYKLYKAGIFIYAFWCTFSFLYTLLSNYKAVGILIGIVAGVIVGIITLRYVRTVLITVSSLNGGFTSAVILLPLLPYSLNSYVVFAAGIVLTISGILFQFKTTKKSDR